MIFSLVLIQSLTVLGLPSFMNWDPSFRPISGRNAEPFRSNMETKYLKTEFGAVFKQRQPNKWERLVLAMKKSVDLSE